jgi:hypothetical protein
MDRHDTPIGSLYRLGLCSLQATPCFLILLLVPHPSVHAQGNSKPCHVIQDRDLVTNGGRRTGGWKEGFLQLYL